MSILIVLACLAFGAWLLTKQPVVGIGCLSLTVLILLPAAILAACAS